MERAQRLTRHHLDLVHRQIEARAERQTVTEKAKARNHSHNRSGSGRTHSDAVLFQCHVEAFKFERRAEIEVLARKLELQGRAITVLLCKLYLDDAGLAA